MLRVFVLSLVLNVWVGSLFAAQLPPYTVHPGDVLQISVWKEPDLQLEVLVRPDGGFTLPLVGEVESLGKTAEMLREEITQRLESFVPDAVVTVALRQLGGHKVYVLGKVNRPGEYPVNRYVDVMQALSIAGGTTTFADLNDITILRRDGDAQRAIEFKYDQVAKGRHLEQNIILQSGDVVVVP